MNRVEGLTRRSRITIRLSTEERNRLDAAANNSAISLSDYVRCVLTDLQPLPAMKRPTVEMTLLARVLSELGKLASDLTAVARAARDPERRGMLTPFLERDLLRVINDLKPCRTLLLEALGKKALDR
ncbi:plasmid mobilization protein [Rhodopseudomonas pseudopalustris]|uniref:Uncharacterized protein n=1 Tax=Rhodopseudomonas pseudopalustris TaxID=1513892 RepID=A0A1H8SR99_9BRAD|nr:hypothetical protein [Rhodopseudomonas pseudopalustris]SEO80858.1 hypothetical protein SAMN05444123_10523 [Rhodopseudomonas pseudopalustris]